jgi:hypothetical protein
MLSPLVCPTKLDWLARVPRKTVEIRRGVGGKVFRMPMECVMILELSELSHLVVRHFHIRNRIQQILR